MVVLGPKIKEFLEINGAAEKAFVRVAFQKKLSLGKFGSLTYSQNAI